MKSKKKLLKKSLLYLIIDKKTAGHKNVYDIAKQATTSGVDVVQFRDKFSKKDSVVKNALGLNKLLSASNTVFIVNDFLDVAKIVDSDGLHIGQSDTSIETARSILGEDKIIGISCHSLKQAILAQNKGADYIGIGPVFATPTKPEYKPIGLELIKELRLKMKIPFFVIGDINFKNINRAILSGAQRIAVCRAILKSKDISLAARKFSKILHQ